MKKRNETLIGIFTCARDAKWQAAALETWMTQMPDTFDVVFIGPEFMPEGIEDTYANLPHKTRALCRYAVEKKYNYLLKMDVDSFLRPKMVRVPEVDYCGRPQKHFCSGGGYWLSKRAFTIIAKSELSEETAEDRWVGTVLRENEIERVALAGYVAPLRPPSSEYLRDPNTILLMQMDSPEQMLRVYDGVFDPLPLPVGSDPSHFPAGSIMRAQMNRQVR